MSLFIFAFIDVIFLICMINATREYLKIKRAGDYTVLDTDSQGGRLIRTHDGKEFWVNWPVTTTSYFTVLILLVVSLLTFSICYLKVLI